MQQCKTPLEIISKRMGRKSNQQLAEKVNQSMIDLFLDSVCKENPALDRNTFAVAIKTGFVSLLKVQHYNVCKYYWERMKNREKKELKKWDVIKETATIFDLTDEAVSYIITRFQGIKFVF